MQAIWATAAFAFNSTKIPVSCTCLSFTKYQCVVGVQCVIIRSPVGDPVDTRIETLAVAFTLDIVWIDEAGPEFIIFQMT